MNDQLRQILGALREGRTDASQAATAVAELCRHSADPPSSRRGFESVIERELPPDEAAALRAALADLWPAGSDPGATRIARTAGSTGDPDETLVRPTPDARAEETVYAPKAPPSGRPSGASPPSAFPADTPVSPEHATGPGRLEGSSSVSVVPASEGKAAISRSIASGRVIKDRFVLQDMIGHGGMGVVYSARDLRNEEAHDRDSLVAIKILSPDFSRHPLALQALQREAKKAHTLSQRNIVTVYDFDRDGPMIFMTMELLQGQPLDALLRRRVAGLSRDEARPIVQAMSAGLAYAHDKGIVHSDFKPGNVFLLVDGTTKILDFGIARAVPVGASGGDGETVFDAGALGGLTPAYAAPEVFADEDPHPADDVFALGLVVYELVSGQHPFDRLPANEAAAKGLSPHRLKKLKRREWRAVSQALSFERSERQQNAAEFWEQFLGRKAMIRRAAVAAIVLPLISAGIAYFGWVEDGFNRLSPAEQAAVLGYLEQAKAARESYERDEAPLGDMYAYLIEAYEVHPANKRVLKGLEYVADETLAQPQGIIRRRSIDVLRTQPYLATYPPLQRAAPANDAG